jgi:tetratricopeptide (TPR) repeat protein/tRNA A-37 threonylcarbamoyl transferase component Bud32
MSQSTPKVPLPATATAEHAPADPQRTVDSVESISCLSAEGLVPAALGRFALAGEIGRGGMGCVLQGHDPALDRDLAIKVLLPAHRGQEDLERRFLEEARIAGRLEHPGIPPVHELGRADDGRPFFAMKLIRGRTLGELLHERSYVQNDLPRFLAIFEQVCQTIAYAHAHGVIHRDLKPANVMVGKYGEVQVMDWGLAKVMGEKSVPAAQDIPVPASVLQPSREALSHAGSVLGTPAYMAPEQARGQVHKLDERTDVFGLGGILSQILTGSPPFTQGETSVLIRRSARGDLGEVMARLDGCGADSEPVTLAKDCLAAEACDRPADAGEVAARIVAYRAGVERRLRQAEVECAAAEARSEEARSKVRAEKRARRLTLGLALSALLLLALGGGGFAWWWMQRSATIHDVETALADAHTHVDEGRWPEARAALERAAGRLGDSGPAKLRIRVEQAQADLSVVRELEEIRLRQAALKDGNFDNRAASPLYTNAFTRYGLDISTPEQAENLLRTSAVREPLLAGLHDWLDITPDETIRQQVGRLLERADDNDWRRRFRALARRDDAAGLKALARQEETLRQAPAILTRLGHALVRVGLSDEAVRLLRRAQRRHPADLWINHDLGSEMRRIGKEKEDAIRFLTVAAALRPNSPGTQYNLGIALVDAGKLDEAVAAYRRTLVLAPKYARAHVNLGIALWKQGKLDEAVASYRKAIALDPKDGAAHTNIGIVLKEQGKLDEAVAACRQAVQLDPKLPQTHYNLGLALYQQNNLDEAIACHRRAIDLDPKDALAYSDLGAALYKQGKAKEAIAAFRQALVCAPKYAPAAMNLGTVLKDSGKLDEAVAAYRQAIGIDPKRAPAYYNLGVALEKQGKADEAIAAYRQALRIDQKLVEAHINLGNILFDQDKLDVAIAEYRQAIALDPKEPKAYWNLAGALRRRGAFVESLDAYRRCHALVSKHLSWRLSTAARLREAEDLVAREKQMLDVLAGKRVPASAAERIAHARLCFSTRRFHAAASLLADAFAIDATLADDLRASNRHNAACAAALAGCGQSEDAAGLDEMTRLRWRRQALTWLRADLAALTRLVQKDTPRIRGVVQTALQGWQKDPNLAGLREANAQAKLPAEEWKACRMFWADVENLRQQVLSK